MSEVIVKNNEVANLAQGSAWRVAYLLEYGGTYRLMYAADANELSSLQGKLPKSQLEHMRGALKEKYQRITPPEVEKLLRAAVGKKYDLRKATTGHNPGKTNFTINQVAGAAKYAGRVFVVVMLAAELEKIRTAEEWRKQLGSSSSGLLGAVVGGWAAGATAGLASGAKSRNPWVTAGSTIIGGIVGGAVGYEVASGLFEQIYDVYLVE